MSSQYAVQDKGSALTPDDIEAWRQRIRTETFANYHYSMGVALARSGEPAQAIESYRKALALNPASPEAVFRLRKLLLAAGDETASEDLHQRALALNPRYEAEAFLHIGLEHLDRSNTEAALPLFEEAVARAPELAEAHYQYAYCLYHFQSAAMEKAKDHFRTAIRRGYLEADAFHYLSWSLCRLPSHIQNQPLVPMERAIALEPHQSKHYLLVSDVQQCLCRFDDALRTLDRLARLGYSAHELNWRRGMSEIARGNPGQALGCLEQARAADPKDVRHAIGLGLAWEAQGEVERALQIYQKITGTTADSAWAWSCLALLHHSRGRIAEALEAHRQALALDAEGAWYHTSYGLTLEAAGRRDDADAAHRKAVDLQVDWLWYHATLRPWAKPLFQAAYQRIGLALPG